MMFLNSLSEMISECRWSQDGGNEELTKVMEGLGNISAWDPVLGLYDT